MIKILKDGLDSRLDTHTQNSEVEEKSEENTTLSTEWQKDGKLKTGKNIKDIIWHRV